MQAQRRTQGLLVEELPEETIVYDTARHEVHCLNRAATLVWNHCDGRTSPAEMADLLREELDLSADEALVRLILEQLGDLNLLDEQSHKPASAARRTRREVSKQLAHYGLAGMMVLTIAAPAAAQAGSGCTSNSQCSGGDICCPPGSSKAGQCKPNLSSCGA